MKLILGMSKDGYFSRCENDDMSWLGSTDKAVFKLLTLSNDGQCGVSYKTAECMPKTLPGRDLYILSTKGRVPFESWGTLDDFHHKFPNGWLLGGPTLAKIALTSEIDYIDEVFICESTANAFPHNNEAIRAFDIIKILDTDTRFNRSQVVPNFFDVKVHIWRRNEN